MEKPILFIIHGKTLACGKSILLRSMIGMPANKYRLQMHAFSDAYKGVEPLKLIEKATEIQKELGTDYFIIEKSNIRSHKGVDEIAVLKTHFNISSVHVQRWDDLK